MDLAQRVAAIRERIEASLSRAGRPAGSVSLVAVTKTVPAEVVVDAAKAGVAVFGENRVQEAAEKIPRVVRLLENPREGGGADLRSGSRASTQPSQGGLSVPTISGPVRDERPQQGGFARLEQNAGQRLSWHLVGHLQSNKASQAVRLFDWIHSVDDLALVRRLESAAAGSGKRQAILVQVNVSGEGTKSGVSPSGLRQVVDAVIACPNLDLRGLMTIPPYHPDCERSRSHFAALRELGNAVRAWLAPRDYPGELSMGMTEDFEVAIEEGATVVRIGRALFGERT